MWFLTNKQLETAQAHFYECWPETCRKSEILTLTRENRLECIVIVYSCLNWVNNKNKLHIHILINARAVNYGPVFKINQKLWALIFNKIKLQASWLIIYYKQLKTQYSQRRITVCMPSDTRDDTCYESMKLPWSENPAGQFVLIKAYFDWTVKDFVVLSSW